MIISSKPSTCILDPIPTKLLKEVFPLINTSLLNIMNMSLLSGYVPHKVTNDLLIASDKGLVSILVLLDLSAAFDTIDHDILLQRLEHLIGIKGTALGWFRSYLSERSQFVCVNDESSMQTTVPQGSVLGPILFKLYMPPLGNIKRNHSVHFHCYADDTELYLSIKPDETNHLNTIQGCLKDLKTWMTLHFFVKHGQN